MSLETLRAAYLAGKLAARFDCQRLRLRPRTGLRVTAVRRTAGRTQRLAANYRSGDDPWHH